MKCLSLLFSFFALLCERMSMKTHSIEDRCYGTGVYTVCRRVRTSFSPESLQAGAVKGLYITHLLSVIYVNAVMKGM